MTLENPKSRVLTNIKTSYEFGVRQTPWSWAVWSDGPLGYHTVASGVSRYRLVAAWKAGRAARRESLRLSELRIRASSEES